MVVLPTKEFDALLEQIEDKEDVRLYNEAIREDDKEHITWDDYFKKRSELTNFGMSANEKSLAKDWLSDADNRWDKIL
jgi:hypothetical protein